MISNTIQTINDSILSEFPTSCGVPVWKTNVNGLVKMVWSTGDKQRLMHDQDANFVVLDDSYDVQFAHVIDTIRKMDANSGINSQRYQIEGVLVGVGTTATAGIFALKAFESLEYSNVSVYALDANTERILSQYWGVDKDTYGQNPQLNAWRITYSYSITELNRNDLLFLEGLTNID